MQFMLDYKPFLIVLEREQAIEPDGMYLPAKPGSTARSGRYPPCDPRWESDFLAQLAKSKAPPTVPAGVRMSRAIKFSLGALASVGFITGCASSTHSSFARDQQTLPQVEFVGDDVSAGLVAYAQNPMWHCDDCAQSAESGAVLANFAAALTTKPDVIVITTGTYDFPQTSLAGTFDEDCKLPDGICTSVMAMVAQAQAAGIKVIVNTTPPFSVSGSAASQYDNCCNVGDEIQNSQSGWNKQLSTLFPKGGSVTLVDTASAIEQSVTGPLGFPIHQFTIGYTDNGIDPNAAGYAVMEPLISAAITAQHAGPEGAR
jgi:hypothetical protein